MPYIPQQVPADPAQLPGFLHVELENVSRATRAPTLQIEMLYVAPKRPRDGLIALADGTSWNPGAGAGVYCYYANAWNKLG